MVVGGGRTFFICKTEAGGGEERSFRLVRMGGNFGMGLGEDLLRWIEINFGPLALAGIRWGSLVNVTRIFSF